MYQELVGSKELLADVGQTREKVSTWTNEVRQSVVAEHSAHEATMSELDSKVETLRGGLSQMATLEIENARLEDKENVDIEREKASIRRLKEKQAIVPQKLDELAQQKAAVQAHLEQLRATAASRAPRDAKAKELHRAVAFYAQWLGLRIEPLEQSSIRMTFTKIDPRHHDRAFSFVLRIDDNDAWALDKCSPAVATSAQLVAKLNDSQDLSAFVVAMRKQFKLSCASS